jgi:hypothetical protein
MKPGKDFGINTAQPPIFHKKKRRTDPPTGKVKETNRNAQGLATLKRGNRGTKKERRDETAEDREKDRQGGLLEEQTNCLDTGFPSDKRQYSRKSHWIR